MRFNLHGKPGSYTESLLCDEQELKNMVKNLDVDVLFSLPFVVRGDNYKERKESLRNLAIDFQHNNDGETDVQLSMEECAEIHLFFETMGRKYGLLREFRENCIC